MAQGLLTNVSLHTLNLAWNGLEDAGCTAIAQALHQNMGLKVPFCCLAVIACSEYRMGILIDGPTRVDSAFAYTICIDSRMATAGSAYTLTMIVVRTAAHSNYPCYSTPKLGLHLQHGIEMAGNADHVTLCTAHGWHGWIACAIATCSGQLSMHLSQQPATAICSWTAGSAHFMTACNCDTRLDS